uniref:hypothetical protein n=1 Tax=Enterococcus faecalis TaxID=1351 RepID=UPI0012ADE20C|nr:hypothetical protein [Enterococcus faecalis]
MNKEKSKNLNESYFISLANSRGSISTLKIAIAPCIIFSICLLFSWNVAEELKKIPPLKDFTTITIILSIVFLIVCIATSFFKFIYNHQVVGTTLVLFMLILMEISILLLSYYLVLFEDNVSIGDQELWTTASQIFKYVIGIVFILSLIYNIFWLKRQLKEGFKEERSQKNLQSKTTVYNSKSLWIIFGLTSIGGIVLGQIRFLFGFGLGVLIVIAFSRLIVEITYLTYLKSKDKKYWEEPPKPTPIKELNKEEKKERKKKQIKIINISASFGFLLFIGWLVERVEIIGVMKTILRGITMLVLLNLLVTCLLWFGSKVKKYLRKEK